jgi:superfamily II DNA or RNA helicase
VDLSKVKIFGNEYDQRDLERAVNIESRNTAAVDLYQQLFFGQLGVSYCISVNHATTLAKAFNERGINAAVISGRQKKKEQREILKKFKKGDLLMLCNAIILTEGFDEPKANVCLNLSPTLSPVKAEQRAGRVLRLAPDNPDKYAYVVDFLDQSHDRKRQPITFAEIIQGAEAIKTGSFPLLNQENEFFRFLNLGFKFQA